MPSLDEVMLAEMREMRQAGQDPTEGAFTGSMPRVMQNRPEAGFVENVFDEISMQPFWLFTKEVTDSIYPVDPSFDPLTRENLKGYEQYASTLREARSPAHMDAMKARITNIEQTKQRLMEESGILPSLVAEFANPVNYLPLGAVRRGGGFVAGALRGGASFAPVAIGEEALRSEVDPTATRTELLTNVATTVVLGGLIGGGLGMFGGPSTVRRLAENYNDFQMKMDGNVPPPRPEAEFLEAGGFVARPTAEPTGLAPAFGFETATNRLTAYRRLISKGVTAAEDLANAMAGEFDVMFNRNKVGPDGTAPLPTQRSAYLEAGMWRGRAADTVQQLDNIYNEYLGGGPRPMTVGNVNIPVTATRVAQAFGARPSDGLMTYQEFMESVFRAHKRDRIEADNPFVERASTIVRKFFDDARDEGVKTGFLFSQRNIPRQIARYENRVSKLKGRIAELEAKIDSLTPNETVELELSQNILQKAERNLATTKGRAFQFETEIDPPSIKMEIPKGERLVGASNDNVEKIDAEIVYGPTGKKRNDKPVNAFYSSEKGTIFFDKDAVLASWVDAPWRTPQVPGVKALPDEAFPTPESWAEFVLRHEIVHTTVRPGPNLSKADYENLVNEIALAQLRRPDGSLKSSSLFAKPAKFAAANDDIVAYRGPASEQFYLPRQWDIEAILADEDGPKKLRATLFQWFKDNPASPRERERLEGLMDDIISWKSRKNPKDIELLSRLEAIGEWRGLSPKQYDLMMELREQLAGQRRLTDKQWDLLLKTSRELRVEIGRLDYLADDANIMARVDRTIKNILREGELGELQVGRGGGGGSFRMARDLDIPNELVADFVERDVGSLIRSYAARAGVGIEYARKFGTRDAEDAIDDAMLQVARESSGSADQIRKNALDTRDEAVSLRDLVLGDAYARNPASLSRKTAQALTAWAAVTQMGGAAITALVETAKPIVVHGVQRTLGFAMDRLADPDTFRRASEETRVLTGEGMEVTLGMHMQRHMEQGGVSAPGISKAGRMFDKATRPLINFAQGPYYVMNLLGPLTDVMKTYAGTMSSHFMLEDIKKVAAGKGSAKLVEKLASYGISVDAAKRIAAQPVEKLTRLNVANTSQWDDPDLVRLFAGAVAGETRRTIVSAGPANKPNITQGFVGKGENMREFALARLPFQYMNFGLAAINKNLLSALQGREANAFMGVAAMVGMGYMVAKLKASDAAWERMDTEEKILRAVNFSGILGLFGDIPNIIENATRGQYGLRPMLDLPPAYGYRMYDDYSQLGTFVGPGGGKIADLYRVFVDDSATAPEEAKAIRRMIPLNDLFYWKSLFTTAERGLTEQLY